VSTKIGVKSAKSCASTTLEVQRYAPLPVQLLLGKCLQGRGVHLGLGMTFPLGSCRADVLLEHFLVVATRKNAGMCADAWRVSEHACMLMHVHASWCVCALIYQ